MYTFMKSTDEMDLAKQMNKFAETHYIIGTQYSTCPYGTDMYHRMYHCVMVEYKQYKKSE